MDGGKKLKRAVSIEELLKKKYRTFPFTGPIEKAMGQPERTGHWFIWGESGHGKTTFIMTLAKQITPYEKVLFNTLEEGTRMTMQMAVEENKLNQCPRGSFTILNKESIEDLKVRLRKRKSPNVIIIDSAQYTFIDRKEFFELDKEFGEKKLFIWSSHAKGKEPLGALAVAIKFHADLTFFIQGFKAFPVKARANRGVIAEPYVIWEEGAQNFHGSIT